MKRKFLRTLALSLAASIISTYCVGTTIKADSNLVPLTDTSGNPILLRGNPISIPKDPPHEKRQFRSAWVATVDNIDIPQCSTEEQFKAAWLKILQQFQDLNMNAVTFQVRPMNDAFYKSNLNPWSAYFSGIQGKDPGWDPLSWMIEETHKRNMEFHAWFNPYRVAQGWDVLQTSTVADAIAAAKLSDDNFAKKHPEYLLKFDSRLILNPGIPEVQKFVQDSIMEVVNKYDIDAVHFDDYFYPYKVGRTDPITGQTISSAFGDNSYTYGDNTNDFETFKKYPRGFSDIDAWRRNNIDTLIQNISKAIKSSKSYVKFGISPFGIWAHLGNHPEGSAEGAGSDTALTSSSSYDDIYADTRKWAKNGWIDYITPQIYWYFAQIPAAPYGELAAWWADVVKGTNCQLYIGHANYKIGSGGAWQNDQEIPNQLKFNSMYPEIKGDTFFSLADLNKNSLKVTDIIKNLYFNTKALVPSMPWLGTNAPNSPDNVSVSGNTISWNDTENNDSAYYVVYRFNGNELGDFEDPQNIIGEVRRTQGQTSITYTDTTASSGQSYTYAVTALNRLNNESKASTTQDAKTAAVQAAVTAISALPDNVTLADEPAVSAARALVIKANDDASITNLIKLTACENAIKTLKVKAAVDAIASLPDSSSVTLSSETTISSARALVTVVKDDSKITNLQKLLDCEAVLKAIKTQSAIAAINNLPAVDTMALTDKQAVLAARKLVTAANSDKDITNLVKLISCEQRLIQLNKEKTANDAISALPEANSLKLSDQPNIVTARSLVTKVNDNAKITNLQKLVDCESKITAIRKAIAAIKTLPAASSITLADEPAVTAARSLVTAANDTGNNITNLSTLTDCEDKIAQLKKEKAAIDAIAALPEAESITLADEGAVVAARALVTVANNNANITNLNKLVDCENKIAQLKGQGGVSQADKEKAAIDAIEALPVPTSITLSDEKAVIQARELVTKANADSKITNYNKLIECEAKIAALKLAKAPQVIESFESGLGGWHFTVGSGTVSGTQAIDTAQKMFGNNSLKINFDFSKATLKTSAAVYEGPGSNTPVINDNLTKIGMWVYATPEAQGYALRMMLYYNFGIAGQTADYLTFTDAINWTGWKYVEASPSVLNKPPYKLHPNGAIRIMASDVTNLAKTGSIYIDDIRAVYGNPSAAVSIKGSMFKDNVKVALSSNDNTAKIYYTTDGNNPTTASTEYSSPITLTETTTIKFIAVDSAGNKSEILSETYTVDEQYRKEKAAIDAITALPATENIVLTDEAAVAAARALVTAANKDANITNLSKLTACETKIVELKAAAESARQAQLAKEKTAIDAITALPTPESIALTDEAVVAAARALVTAANKDVNITNLSKLTACEQKISELKAAESARQAQLVKEKTAIDAITALSAPESITLTDESAVKAARVLVTAANNDVNITNLSKLTACEQKISELKAAESARQAQLAKEKATIDAITALPAPEKIALTDEVAVSAARALVTAANNDANITNLSKLTACEAKITELKHDANIKETIDKITKAPDKSNTEISIAENSKVKKSILDAIQGKDKSVTFTNDTISWTFDGKDMKGSTKDLDLSVNIADINQSTTPNKEAIKEKINGADALILSFAENGVLPGKATVKVKLSDAWLLGKDLKNIYVYYYNPQTKAIEAIAEKLTVDANGYITFSIDHNSDYFVVDKNLQPKQNLPKTGNFVDFNVLVAAGLISIIVGLSLLLKRKIRRS